MKLKKFVISSIVFVMLLAITLYIIFSKYNFNTILENILLVNPWYLIICLILVLLYFVFQGLYMKYLLGALNEKTTLLKCTFYSILEFFFSAITPSSTGGQPAQVYYMSKDDIPVRKSLIVLILNTMIFKLFLIVGGFFIFLFTPSFFLESGFLVRLFFVLGIVIDIALIIIGYMLMYKEVFIRKIIDKYYKMKKVVLKKEYNSKKIDELLSKYMEEAAFISTHKKEILVSIGITFIQRIFMFSLLYVLYRSFGFNTYSYFELLLLQIFIQISVEGLILPGGVGVSEFVSTHMYLQVFGALSASGMILNRTLSFYIPLLVILMVIFVVTRVKYFDKKE